MMAARHADHVPVRRDVRSTNPFGALSCGPANQLALRFSATSSLNDRKNFRDQTAWPTSGMFLSVTHATAKSAAG